MSWEAPGCWSEMLEREDEEGRRRAGGGRKARAAEPLIRSYLQLGITCQNLEMK